MSVRSFVISLFLLTPSAAFSQNAEVDIPDPGLELAIQRALGVTSDVFTQADLESLTLLYAEERSISDLSGLEFATNLRVLDLGDNKLTDISVLAKLLQLTELRVHGNKIADVSPLSQLTSLTTLNLWGNNRVVDLEPLRELTQLKVLSLGYNRIRSTAPLSGLVNLEGLNISNNPIVDLALPPSDRMKRLHAEGLGLDDVSAFNYPNLETLDLTFNSFRNIETFGQFPQLRELRLGHNRIDDLDEIAPFENLEVLDLSHNHVSSLLGLGQLTKLSVLTLAHNAITDLNPLRSLKNLASIRLWNAPVADIDLLLGFPKLQDASLTGMFLDLTPGTAGAAVVEALKANGVSVAVSGQRPVATVKFSDGRMDSFFRELFARGGQEVTTLGLASLIELKLKNEGIRKLTGLEHLINLRSLDLSGNQIADLMPISELRGLTRLTLSKNDLTDISELSRLTKLRRLELDRNAITDLFPITNLFRLESIDLSDNRLTDISALIGKQANVVVDRNFLRVAPGSRNQTVIDSLVMNGLNVAFEPQIPSEPVAVGFEASGQTCKTTWYAEPGTYYSVLTSEDLVDWRSGSLFEGSGALMRFDLFCRQAMLPRQFVRVIKYVE